MIYEFMADDGRLFEAHYPASEAPALGVVRVFEDPRTGQPVDARRVISTGTMFRPVWKPYVSRRLPRYLDGVDCTPDGKPIINSQADEREAFARAGCERE